MKISFVIPFHNEEKNCQPMIEKVVKYARKNNLTFEIIAVDDRSSDKTRVILKKIAKNYPKIIRPVYRNYDIDEKGNTMGKALIEGTRSASGSIVIWTMGDLADDVSTYTTIIKKIKSGYDLVFGSRYMHGGSRGSLDPFKAFLSSWGTILARLLFGIKVHDITNAFRGFRKEIFDKLKITSSGFSISPEIAIKAHLAGFKLGEVPTTYKNRIEGVSNFKLIKMSKSYLTLYFEIFLKYKILRRSV